MNRYFLKLIKRFSYHDIDIKRTYPLVRKAKDMVAVSPERLKYNILDLAIPSSLDGYQIPTRIFKPENADINSSVIIFFHGGGWVTGNIDNYSKICAELSKHTSTVIISVDYRLAPEFKFPVGLTDCYDATCVICENMESFGFKKENSVLMGDSAGGNLAAALSLMLRDKNKFSPNKQILVYPSTYNIHNKNSPFRSVKAFGNDYVLTSKRICDYMELYAEKQEDFSNPYFAPLLEKNLSGQPDTLILTAWYDPLRDEGEEYGNKLAQFGNYVEIYRIFDTIHGFLILPSGSQQMSKAYRYINEFLNRRK
ncbi:MAG: alpha/beta hydrolase [Oscillospiraceae bacterium]